MRIVALVSLLILGMGLSATADAIAEEPQLEMCRAAAAELLRLQALLAGHQSREAVLQGQMAQRAVAVGGAKRPAIRHP